MKKKLLLLATFMLSVAGAFAQEWAEPEQPTKGSEVVSGHKYRIKNVAASAVDDDYNPNGEGYFLSGGSSWYSWATSTVLVNAAEAEPLTFKVVKTDDGYTFARTSDGKYTFISGHSPQGLENTGEMHVDQGSQDANLKYFDIQKVGDYYRVFAAQNNPAFDISVYSNGEPTLFWGWKLDNWDGNYPTAVYGTVSPNDGYGCDWEFIDYSVYEARLALYNMSQDAIEYKVDLATATKIYNNPDATVEELERVTADLKQAIAVAKANAFLKGASAENPVDATELIENADFSAGNINGWVNSFVSGTTATNCGYQQNNYTGPVWTDPETGEDYTPVLTKFIEAWANNVNEMKRDGKSFATIGDAKLYQIIYGLPAGKYKLSCDAIAVQQWDGSQNPVTGVQLYVIAGSLNASENLSSGNEKPEHRVLTFIHDGGDVELGMRTESTTANWIAASNFHLTYFGEITENPYQVMLNDYVVDLEKKYGDVEDIKAGSDAKSAYESALSAAQDAQDGQGDEYYQNLKSELEAAVAGLNTSIDAYKHIANTLDEAETRAAEAENSGWEELANEIYDNIVNKYKEEYDNGTLTAEEAENINEELNDLIADYVSQNVKEGDDVTLLLKNPGFTTGFSGWVNTGGTLAWSNNYAQGENQAEAAANIEAPSREDGLAEKWHEKFTMSQTIKNMPRGLYTLSCQGFNRHDDGEDNVSAVLYAILPDGSEQTAPFASIDDYATEEKLYDNGEWSSDAERNGKWAPNGMSGSAWHFMNKSDGENYDYESKINIIMTEAGDLTVGARCDYEHQWVIFDNFRIVYKGSGANVYADAIADKIKEGEKAIADGQEDDLCGASAAVIKEWGKIVSAAEAASTEEDCIQALTDLDAAIEAIKASNALAMKVRDAWAFNAEIRLDESGFDDDELNGVLDDIFDKLNGNGFRNDDEMEQAIIDMDAAFCKAAINEVADQLASATEEDPINLTSIIGNYAYDMQYTEDENPVPTAACWTNSRGFGWMAPGTTECVMAENELGTYHIAECWNSVFSTSQKLYNLPAGYYRLSVNAFQRGYGFNKHSAMAEETGEDLLPAVLYAGNAQATIVSLFSEGDNYTFEGATVEGGKYAGQTVPNSMGQAAEAFNAGLFHNILQFKVDEASEVKAFASQVAGVKDCIEIGIKKESNEDDSWVIWGGWKLDYLGKVEPSKDPTTAIEAVSPIVAAQYYNVNGVQQSRLQKGVNIVKVNRANGSTKMVKVLVK